MTQQPPAVDTNLPHQSPDALPPANQPIRATFDAAGTIDSDAFRALNSHFRENRDQFPAEQLAAYAGQWVAWWPDGTRIIDADDTAESLIQRLRANGYQSLEYVVEHISDPEESIV